ncbi:MAG TPA: PQQ-binding-like beta-propeller repeat protein [Chitinophagaceae bacterium]|nr:PQQ-binding-like beta-propeller repeat protein [Chitinophagaceae bacterium]
MAKGHHEAMNELSPRSSDSTRLLLIILVMVFSFACKRKPDVKLGEDWPSYGGNSAGNRYSPLNQINLDNVKDLAVAWEYDASEKPDPANPSQRAKEIQCQPIVVDGILYGTTPELKLFALTAATGEQLWKFEPAKENQRFNTNRGVIYWENGDDKRILYSAGAWLYAVNAIDGKPVITFGNNGRVDLHEGLSTNIGHDVSSLSVTATTPGALYKNTIVIGSSVSEGGDAAPGHVRAFDVVTGKLKWTFHTIPQPGEFGYDTWPPDAYKKIGAANNWSGLVMDDKRGVVYFGTGSPSSDFFGADRHGTNLFANCIMALEAETGKMKWYFQTIHHDLWDRDIPCPPNLVTIKHNGQNVDVVVQATKDGLVYVLDREKGTSLFPIEERKVPVNGLPGEQPWPVQQYPSKPLPFTHQVFTENDITDISPAAHDFVMKAYEQYRSSDNKFTPPNATGTLLFGYSGGAEWGGNSIDPDGILYLNANEDAWELQMIDMETRNRELASVTPGHALYIRNCASCHGMDRKGSGEVFPNLVNIAGKRSAAEIGNVIKAGSGRMPSFQQLGEADRSSITNFLLNKEPKMVKPVDEHTIDDTAVAKENDFPYIPAYTNKTWKKFTDQDGYNAVKPPWGTLNAIDLNTGDYLWRVPLGEFPELTKKGIPITGTENYGGPISTAGGLIFIAATRDERIRAFDRKTGKVVWEYQLPAGGFATPVTYAVDGKQYIVIAAGGARGKKAGGKYVAFALK